jgi:hypothetical protein
MFHRLKGEEDHNDFKPSHIRAFCSLRGAAWLARRAIVAAKLCRSRGELICRAGVSIEDYAKPVADAARWPQAPLILGDKWDF